MQRRQTAALVAEAPLDGKFDLERAADIIDSNESLLIGRVDIALGVHVEDGRAAAAGRPRPNTGLAGQVKVLAVRSTKLDRGLHLVKRPLAEVEDVLASTGGASGDLREAAHVGVHDGELVTIIKLHVHGELAVLAPVAGLGAGAGLDNILGEGGLEDGAGGINLDISGSLGASGAEKGDVMDLDLAGLTSTGFQDAGSGGSEAEEKSDSREDLHFE